MEAGVTNDVWSSEGNYRLARTKCSLIFSRNELQTADG